MKKFSIRTMINGLTLSVILISFVINLIIIYYTWLNVVDIRKKNIETVSYQLSNYLIAENERLGRIQRELIGQALMNGFLSDGENMFSESSRKEMSEYVYDMQTVNNNPLYAMVIDTEKKYHVISETLLSEELEQIKRVSKAYEGEFEQDETSKYEYFIIDEPNFSHMLYVCRYEPAYNFSADSGKLKYVGNMVVCTKLSIERLMLEYEDWANLDLSLEKNGNKLEFMQSRNPKKTSGFAIYPIDIKNTDWRVNGVIYETELAQKLSSLIWTMVFGVLCVIMLVIFYHRKMSKIISKPVYEIVNYLNRRADGREKNALEVKGSFEFNEIAESINKLIESDHEKTKYIFSQQQRLYDYEIQTKEAALKNLQGQVNPHFLYNTLECVRALALINGADDVANIAVDLAEIMRYSLDRSELVTVRDEVMVLESYLSIMNARYKNRFRCEIDIPEEILDCRLMKMILQPILENSFKHGLKITKEGNVIRIKGHLAGEDVFLSVWDNGKGLTESHLEELRNRLKKDMIDSKKQIGIWNAHQRIKTFFGESYGIQIDSKFGEYTEVMLKIPKKIK